MATGNNKCKVVHRETFQNANQLVEVLIRTKPKLSSKESDLLPKAATFRRNCPIQNQLQKVNERQLNKDKLHQDKTKHNALNKVASSKKKNGHVVVEVAKNRRLSKSTYSKSALDRTWSDILNNYRSISIEDSHLSGESSQDLFLHDNVDCIPSKGPSASVNYREMPPYASQGPSASSDHRERTHYSSHHSRRDRAIQTSGLSKPPIQNEQLPQSSFHIDRPSFTDKETTVGENIQFISENIRKLGENKHQHNCHEDHYVQEVQHPFTSKHGKFQQEQHKSQIPHTGEEGRLLSDGLSNTPFSESALKLLQQIRRQLQQKGDSETSEALGELQQYLTAAALNANQPTRPVSRNQTLSSNVFNTPIVPQSQQSNLAQQQFLGERDVPQTQTQNGVYLDAVNKLLHDMAEQHHINACQAATIAELRSLSGRLLAHHTQAAEKTGPLQPGTSAPDGRSSRPILLGHGQRQENVNYATMQGAAEKSDVLRNNVSRAVAFQTSTLPPEADSVQHLSRIRPTGNQLNMINLRGSQEIIGSDPSRVLRSSNGQELLHGPDTGLHGRTSTADGSVVAVCGGASTAMPPPASAGGAPTVDGGAERRLRSELWSLRCENQLLLRRLGDVGHTVSGMPMTSTRRLDGDAFASTDHPTATHADVAATGVDTDMLRTGNDRLPYMFSASLANAATDPNAGALNVQPMSDRSDDLESGEISAQTVQRQENRPPSDLAYFSSPTKSSSGSLSSKLRSDSVSKDSSVGDRPGPYGSGGIPSLLSVLQPKDITTSEISDISDNEYIASRTQERLHLNNSSQTSREIPRFSVSSSTISSCSLVSSARRLTQAEEAGGALPLESTRVSTPASGRPADVSRASNNGYSQPHRPVSEGPSSRYQVLLAEFNSDSSTAF